MDNFNLKQYLAEGRLSENDRSPEAAQRIKDLKGAIRQLEATCDSIRSMEDQQYIRNTIENYKEQIERLQGGGEMRWSDKTKLEENDEDYNDVVEWDWEYIDINSKGDVNVPCTITLDYGDEPFHVHLSAGELDSHGINVEGKDPVNLTDGETEAILDMVEAKIQAEY